LSFISFNRIVLNHPSSVTFLRHNCLLLLCYQPIHDYETWPSFCIISYLIKACNAASCISTISPVLRTDVVLTYPVLCSCCAMCVPGLGDNR
jgi:hypothetical protein